MKNLELSQYKYTPDVVLTNKGIYPYEYMDSFERFPPKGKFYSTQVNMVLPMKNLYLHFMFTKNMNVELLVNIMIYI